MTATRDSAAVSSTAKKSKGDRTIHHDHATTPVIFRATRRAVTRIAGLMAYCVLIGFMVLLYTSSVGCQAYTLLSKSPYVFYKPLVKV